MAEESWGKLHVLIILMQEEEQQVHIMEIAQRWQVEVTMLRQLLETRREASIQLSQEVVRD